MNSFNHYMNSHFKGLTVLGTLQDPYRNRAVTAYLIPGHDDIVGVSDGVDSWMATPHQCLREIPLSKIMEAIKNGEEVTPLPLPIPRRTIHTQDVQPITRRRITHGN